MNASRASSVDADEIRAAKEALIADGLLRAEHPLWLPGEIDRSWRRSVSAGAHRASGFQFVNEYDADSELCRAARPVLDGLQEILHDMGTAIFLADRTGQIVAPRVPDRSEQARFDQRYAVEGFDFSEDSIGTNGLGTPMHEGSAVFVRGAEHFNEALEDLACAGIGIRHPGTGRLIGSLSLAAPADAAERMMVALTRQGAHQIVENLRTTLGRREVALGQSYQAHRDKGPVIVLNSDTVMTNVTGLSFLDVETHARLWSCLVSHDWERGPQLLDLDLDHLRARVRAHRLADQDNAFAVEILDRPQEEPATRPARVAAPRDPVVRNLQKAAGRATGAVAVTGPSGSGKLHAVEAWLRSEGHTDPLVLEAGDLAGRASWRQEAGAALGAGRPVVVRRLEDLDPTHVNGVKALAADLAAARGVVPAQPAGPRGADPHAPRLVVTADLDRSSDAVVQMLAQIAVGVDVPPLASRREELPGLVRSILAGTDVRRRPVLSAATMQVLMRWDWPGNVAELRHVLLGLAAELPGQSVSPYHLPDRMWDAAERRPLTRIESAERTEIIAALRQAGGNRSKAASMLGIGRTTLYRKLAAFGIDDDALLP